MQVFNPAYATYCPEWQLKQSVLTYQFVAGLIDPIKAKIVGAVGTFDELLAKARFEEARIKEIGNMPINPHLNQQLHNHQLRVRSHVHSQPDRMSPVSSVEGLGTLLVCALSRAVDCHWRVEENQRT